MYIIEQITAEQRPAHILPTANDDFKKLTSTRYSFNWKKLKKENVIYKLTLKDNGDILGLMALHDYPAEERIEIKLLAVSVENIGKNKKYERIAGCMIAFAGRNALLKFKNDPVLSLVPKTELRRHYSNKYGMIDAGWQLYLEGKALLNVVNEYLP